MNLQICRKMECILALLTVKHMHWSLVIHKRSNKNIWYTIYSFLPHDVQYMLSSCVCLSDTSIVSKQLITETTQHDSQPKILAKLEQSHP